MAKKTTRRAVLGSLGLATGSFALGRLLASSEAGAADANDTSAWVYHRLDPSQVAVRGYGLYPKGSCMYAVFSAIVKELADQHGEPYAAFPCRMMGYGHGGVGGWGTLCGTLNGAAAAMGLFVASKSDCDLLIDSLFHWYRSTELPIYAPPEDEGDFVTSKPSAVLCHVSSSKWAEKADVSVTDPLRKERCRRISADVAGRTAELLNDYLDGKLPQKLPISAADFGEAAITKMRCTICHDIQG